MIEAKNRTKRFGGKTAVDDLSFTVHSGIVTGFLGPSGAAKSTAMRMISASTPRPAALVTVGGKPYRKHARPLQVVGALLEAPAVRTSRSAYHHLLVFAATHGITNSRVADVIEMVGLQDVAHQRAGGFSLGTGQRLGIASAHRRACHHVVGRGRMTAGMPPSSSRRRSAVQWSSARRRPGLWPMHSWPRPASQAWPRRPSRATRRSALRKQTRPRPPPWGIPGLDGGPH